MYLSINFSETMYLLVIFSQMNKGWQNYLDWPEVLNEHLDLDHHSTAFVLSVLTDQTAISDSHDQWLITGCLRF